eukprot:COSAG02_NODE_754_length_17578_cov_97.544825_12_plen_120_part_00
MDDGSLQTDLQVSIACGKITPGPSRLHAIALTVLRVLLQMVVSAHRRVVLSKLEELRAANSGPQAVRPGGGGGIRPTHAVLPVAARMGPAAVGTSVAQKLATARSEISALRSSLTIAGR